MDLAIIKDGWATVIVKDIDKEEYYDHDDRADLGELVWEAVETEKEKK